MTVTIIDTLRGWGDVGQSDDVAPEPRMVKLAAGEVLVVTVPQGITLASMVQHKKAWNEVRKRLGWKGEILVFREGIGLEKLSSEQPKRLSQTDVERLCGALSKHSQQSGVNLKAAVRGFEALRAQINKAGDAIREFGKTAGEQLREAAETLEGGQPLDEDEAHRLFGDSWNGITETPELDALRTAIHLDATGGPQPPEDHINSRCRDPTAE